MRIVIITILVGAFMTLGFGSSWANTPCSEELNKATGPYEKGLLRSSIAEKRKLKSAMVKIKKALVDGDNKTCHMNVKKILNITKHL